MKRDIRKSLIAWKANPLRMPLVIRGARQVGKTYSIQAFGHQEFENTVTINFEASPEFEKCFEKMDPVAIVSQIELLSNQKIAPGQTLLFLDEIQQCPKALQALRYFKEQLPALHLIAAGSLLEFALSSASFPVGRVQFARLLPLSFGEYLDAREKHALREHLHSYTPSQAPPPAVHDHLIQLVKDYFVIGGMPTSINTIRHNPSLLELKYVQQSLLNSFESDFGKYAKQSKHRHLKKIFQEVPRLIGSQVKYSRIDPELPNPAREMKQALEYLKLAGLIHPIRAAAGTLPLSCAVSESIFKLIFLDIGLVQQVMNLDQQNPGLMTGPLAEQFVGQELLAATDPFLDAQLYYWNRKNGDAEVDYLIEHRGAIYPIEVKAGKTGKLKSLHFFMKEKNPPLGIKISTDLLKFEDGILSVPFYLISELPRLIDAVQR